MTEFAYPALPPGYRWSITTERDSDWWVVDVAITPTTWRGSIAELIWQIQWLLNHLVWLPGRWHDIAGPTSASIESVATDLHRRFIDSLAPPPDFTHMEDALNDGAPDDRG